MMNGNLLKYKDFYGTVEYSAADEILFGKVIGIRGLVSYEGKSVEELKEDFEAAVEDYLDYCEENNIEPEKQYKGSFNVRISPELHKNLSLYASSHGETLNAAVEQAIRNMVEVV